MSEMDALKFLNKLQVKSDLVQWNNDTRKEYFVFVAKKVLGGKSRFVRRDFLFFMVLMGGNFFLLHYGQGAILSPNSSTPHPTPTHRQH